MSKLWGALELKLGQGHVTIYKDKGRKWRWQRVAGNGQIVAASGESFASRRNAIRSARKTFGI